MNYGWHPRRKKRRVGQWKSDTEVYAVAWVSKRGARHVNTFRSPFASLNFQRLINRKGGTITGTWKGHRF